MSRDGPISRNGGRAGLGAGDGKGKGRAGEFEGAGVLIILFIINITYSPCEPINPFASGPEILELNSLFKHK